MAQIRDHQSSYAGKRLGRKTCPWQLLFSTGNNNRFSIVPFSWPKLRFRHRQQRNHARFIIGRTKMDPADEEECCRSHIGAIGPKPASHLLCLVQGKTSTIEPGARHFSHSLRPSGADDIGGLPPPTIGQNTKKKQLIMATYHIQIVQFAQPGVEQRLRIVPRQRRSGRLADHDDGRLLRLGIRLGLAVR